MEQIEDFALTCPIPISRYPAVLLAHGGSLFSPLPESLVVLHLRNSSRIDIKRSSKLCFLLGLVL